MNDIHAPSPPPPPPSRMISEVSGELCRQCGSTMMRKRFVFVGERPGCIQPECDNYGGVHD